MNLNPQGEFYRRCHNCPCGSQLISEWCKNEKGNEVLACDQCKPKLLYSIFEDKNLDIFEEWMGSLLSDPPPLGYQWQWEDFLKEKGCEQVIGLEEAKQRRKEGQFLIACPNGDSTDSDDESVYILIPEEYADLVLKKGKMV